MLPSSGAISASQINVELGRASNAAFDINGADERALAEVPSGAISFSDFHGKEHFGFEVLATVVQAYADPTTFASQSFGTAHADRRMFVHVHFFGLSGANNVLNSATIGGVAATIHAQDGNRNTATNGTHRTAIISAIVPTGTTGDIVLDWSGASSGTVTIKIIRTKGLVGGVIDTFAGHCSGACSSVSGTVNVPAEGVIFAATTGMGGGENVTLTNPTPANYDTANVAGIAIRDQAANPSRTVSATISGSDTNITIVAVTWTGL